MWLCVMCYVGIRELKIRGLRKVRWIGGLGMVGR
jgi:hypothetical protein